MKPPICCICALEFDPGEGDLVAFADYRPLPEETVGQPRGLEWFCPEHLDDARALRELSSGRAISKLRGD